MTRQGLHKAPIYHKGNHILKYFYFYDYFIANCCNISYKKIVSLQNLQ